MDIKRITSGLLGFPLVLIILIFGNNIVVSIALAAIAILAMNEYFNAISKVAKPVKWLGYLSCFSIAAIPLIPSEYLGLVVTLGVPLVLMILFAQVIATEMKTDFKDIAFTFIGIFYIVFFIMFVALIDGMPNGKILIWYIIIASWGTDIVAFFAGTLFGKHKFSKISPKKSVEGCISRNNRWNIINVFIYIYSKYILWYELFIFSDCRSRSSIKLNRTNRRFCSI